MAYLLPGRLWRQKQVEQVIAGVRQKNIVQKHSAFGISAVQVSWVSFAAH